MSSFPMVKLIFALVALALGLSRDSVRIDAARISSKKTEEPLLNTSLSLKPPDGLLRVFFLPIGQGDFRVIQCPSGHLTVMDAGSKEGKDGGFWREKELRAFLGDQLRRVYNFVLTHNHQDHYSLFPSVFKATDKFESLRNFYISCTAQDLPEAIAKWVNKLQMTQKIRTFQGGKKCGTTGYEECGYIDICPRDPSVKARVIGANLGQRCDTVDGNKNPDSIVVELTYLKVKVRMDGDFEDFGTSPNEKGPQRSLIDIYGTGMETTVYQLSHHGADLLANKMMTLEMVKPKAIVVSSNPFYKYRHPRCSVIDKLVQNVGSLCMPGSFTRGKAGTNCSSFVRGQAPLGSNDLLQKNYICGETKEGKEDGEDGELEQQGGGRDNNNNYNNNEDEKEGEEETDDVHRNDRDYPDLRFVTDNRYAVYATVSDARTLNAVEFVSDGRDWYMRNNYSPWIRKIAVNDQSAADRTPYAKKKGGEGKEKKGEKEKKAKKEKKEEKKKGEERKGWKKKVEKQG